jgi:hypothetical protein
MGAIWERMKAELDWDRIDSKFSNGEEVRIDRYV